MILFSHPSAQRACIRHFYYYQALSLDVAHWLHCYVSGAFFYRKYHRELLKAGSTTGGTSLHCEPHLPSAAGQWSPFEINFFHFLLYMILLFGFSDMGISMFLDFLDFPPFQASREAMYFEQRQGIVHWVAMGGGGQHVAHGWYIILPQNPNPSPKCF